MARTVEGLVENGSILYQFAVAQVDMEIALRVHVEALGSLESHVDLSRVRAGAHQPIILHLVLIAMINQVDAVIDILIFDLAKGGNVSVPEGRVVAEQVVDGP